jgi:hypothetical protein
MSLQELEKLLSIEHGSVNLYIEYFAFVEKVCVETSEFRLVIPRTWITKIRNYCEHWGIDFSRYCGETISKAIKLLNGECIKKNYLPMRISTNLGLMDNEFNGLQFQLKGIDLFGKNFSELTTICIEQPSFVYRF